MAIYRSPFGVTTQVTPNNNDIPVALPQQVAPSVPTLPKRSQDEQDLIDRLNNIWDNKNISQSQIDMGRARENVTQAESDALRAVGGSTTLDLNARQKVEAEIARIYGGEPPKVSDRLSVLPDFLEKPVRTGLDKTLEFAGDVVGTPGRIVQSAAKEISDIRNIYSDGTFFPSDKDQFSFVDFFQQSFDPDWAIADMNPIQDVASVFGADLSNNSWVNKADSALDLIARIAGDPVTWTVATPLKYAGGSGRAALATDVGTVLKAGSKGRPTATFVSRAPKRLTSGMSAGARPASVAGKTVIDDAYIAREMSAAYRFGEFGLSPETRMLLQASGKLDPQGVRVFGQVIPNTAGGAELIGGSLSKARAGIGDKTVMSQWITPADRLGLVNVARGKGGTVAEQMAAFTVYEANKFAQAGSSKIVNELASDNKDILKRANTTSMAKTRADGRTGWQHVNDFMEGVSTAIDDDVVEIASSLRTAYDDALARINALRQEMSDRYGLNLEPIDRLDNYVHRTLSQQAASAARSEFRILNRNNRSTKWDSVRKSLNVTEGDLARNEGFTFSRTNAKTFMGEKLANNSVSAYNDIAMRQLGYKIFEDNPAVIMRNYLSSLGAQTRREMFVGRLLQTNPKAIMPFIKDFPMTPNTLRQGIEALEETIDGLVGNTIRSQKDSPSVVAQVEEQAKLVLNSFKEEATEPLKTSAAVARRNRVAQKRLDEVATQLRALEARAARAKQGYDTTLETVVKPLRQRVEQLRNAIDTDATAADNARLWMLEKHKQVFPDALERPTTIEGLAKEIIGDADTRLRGAAKSGVVSKTEQVLAEGATKGRTVDVDGVTMKVTEAKTERVAVSKQLKAAQKQLDDAVGSDPTLKLYKDTEKAVARAQVAADTAGALAGTRAEWENTVGVLLREDIADMKDVIKAMPKVGDGYEANVEWLMKVRDTMDNIQMLDVPEAQKDALDRIFTMMFADEGRVARIEAMTDDLARMNVAESKVADYLGSGDWMPDLQKGWQEIKNLHVQISPELDDAINRVYQQLDEMFLQRITDPATHSYLKEMFLTMNAYFKGTALMTVGYSVRNAMTAAWNNMAMGVTGNQTKRAIAFAWNNMRYGLKRALDMVEEKAYADAIKNKKSKDAARRIASIAKSNMESAYMAVQHSGGNRILDEVVPRIGRQKRIYENKALNMAAQTGDYVFRPFSGRLSAAARQGNEHVEMGARMGLALNGIEQGMTPMAAGARVARVQFDYTQLSKLDEAMKLIIPFWVFASRNVPLQIVQQVARPSLYSAHKKVVEASGGDRENLPYYRARKSPIKLPFGNWWADWDLPQTSIGETIETFTSPSRFYSEFSPIIRSPAEFLFQTTFYDGEPVKISDNYRPLGVTDLFMAPFSTEVGDPELGGIGGRAVNARYVDPIKGAMPAVTNLEKYLITLFGGEDAPREIGGNDRAYQEGNRLNTLFGAAGLGLFNPTQRQLVGEQRRRAEDLKKIVEELEKKGYVSK